MRNQIRTAEINVLNVFGVWSSLLLNSVVCLTNLTSLIGDLGDGDFSHELSGSVGDEEGTTGLIVPDPVF